MSAWKRIDNDARDTRAEPFDGREYIFARFLWDDEGKSWGFDWARDANWMHWLEPPRFGGYSDEQEDWFTQFPPTHYREIDRPAGPVETFHRGLRIDAETKADDIPF